MQKTNFFIEITGSKGVYECKVQEHLERKETFYLVDILSPRPLTDDGFVTEQVYEVEMRIDCNTNTYKIKRYFKDVPPELLQIEKMLSDALCKYKQPA